MGKPSFVSSFKESGTRVDQEFFFLTRGSSFLFCYYCFGSPWKRRKFPEDKFLHPAVSFLIFSLSFLSFARFFKEGYGGSGILVFHFLYCKLMVLTFSTSLSSSSSTSFSRFF